MSRSMLASLVLAAFVAACGGGEREDTAAADSLSRDLQLAPVDTQATLNDQPAQEPEPVAAAPAPARRPPARREPAQPRPEPREEPRDETPAQPAGRSLAAGTAFQVTTTEEISSRTNKVGDRITATVADDVKNSAGQVVVPAGSEVTFTITAIHESENKSDTGTLTLAPATVMVGGQSYELAADISGLSPELRGRGTGVGDVAKVGAGAAAGAVVGRVLGGSTKGAVIGGIIGGAVGTQRAVETKDRDVVVPAGSAVTVELTERLTVEG